LKRAAFDPLVVLWSKHRVEALTDGIFAVAMTLLVIELKVPDPHLIHSQEELLQALADLVPKAASWIISFLVLSVFWISHHRLFHYVRYVDTGLLWRNLFQLGFVSLMPFSAALLGEFAAMLTGQVVYNGNMVMLGLLSLWKIHYVRKHPELTSHPMETGTYHATLLRSGGLVVAGASAMALGIWVGTSFATLTYLAMVPIGRYGKRLERSARAGGDNVKQENISNDHP
jgi:uncharacterized membrane protein